MDKKKQTYEAPLAEVMVVKTENSLLLASVESTREGYGTASEANGTIQEWD